MNVLRVFDKSFAIGLAALSLVIHIGLAINEGFTVVTLLPMTVFSLGPSLLLWIGKPCAYGVLMLAGCCITQGAYMFCDISQGDPWGLLHTTHEWILPFIPLYAIVRLILYAVQNKKQNVG